MTDVERSGPRTARRGQVPTIQRMLVFLVAATAVLVDQLSKALVEAVIPLNTMWAPLPSLAHFFRITHVSNTGAAFGLFPTGGLLFAGIAALVAGVIIIYNFTLPAGQFTVRLALGLQLGGALGNLIDRLHQGYVTDYLDFGPWPVFNLADTAIVAGVCLLALAMWREEQEDAAGAGDLADKAIDGADSLAGMVATGVGDGQSEHDGRGV